MSEVSYIISKDLLAECNKIPVLRNRASMIYELIRAYKLLEHMKFVKPRAATEDELATIHSRYYLDYLKAQCTAEMTGNDSDTSDVDDEQIMYGLGYDCPKIQNLWKFAKIIAGGSISAADLLLNGQSKIVINWCGGWHHAQRDEAEGFCYINDIAVAIQRLRTRFQRVLYIDLDVHHGNGVENAFAYTKRVFTVSFHQYHAGFFPGSGNVNDCGFGNGKGYCVNFPYKPHIRGDIFVKYFRKTMDEIISIYQPDVCVVQCGADVIVGDPLGGTNLIPEDLGRCIKRILSWNLPMMFLGGGGYNFANTARYWTYLTSIICKLREPLNTDVPDNQFFLQYGPGYELNILRNNPDDLNTENEMEAIYQIIKENVKSSVKC